MIPRVSIIMTVRDGEKYLAATLESIKRQTFVDYELVAVNNGSTDGTCAILSRYAAADSRIRIIDVPDTEHGTFTQGIARALGAAIAPYVAVNDSDDLSMPHRLERQVALLDEDAKVVLAGCWFDDIDADGNILATYTPPAHMAGLIEQYQYRSPLAHSGVMYRRAAAVCAGGYDPHFAFASDIALQIRMILNGGEVRAVPERLVQIRQHPAQTSLMRDDALRRHREPLEVKLMARALPGASFAARWKGIVVCEKLAIKCAIVLWQRGHRFASAFEAIKSLFVSAMSAVLLLVPRGPDRTRTRAAL